MNNALIYASATSYKESLERIYDKLFRKVYRSIGYYKVPSTYDMDNEDIGFFVPNPSNHIYDGQGTILEWICHDEMMKAIQHFVERDKPCFLWYEHGGYLIKIDDVVHNEDNSKTAGLIGCDMSISYDLSDIDKLLEEWVDDSKILKQYPMTTNEAFVIKDPIDKLLSL